MRRYILIVWLTIFLGSSSFVYAIEEKSVGEVFYSSVVNRSIVKTAAKWTDEEASQSYIDDSTEGIIFIAKVADFFGNVKPTWKEAWFKNMRIREVYNFHNLALNKDIHSYIIKSNFGQITTNLTNLEKEISRVGQLKIPDYKKVNLINKLKNQQKILLKNKDLLSNNFKKSISSYKRLTGIVDKDINLNGFKSVAKDTLKGFRNADTVGKGLALLGIVSIATDIVFTGQDALNGKWKEAGLNLANGAIHTAELVPIVGIITTPIEITMNFGIDYYDNHTTEVSGEFAEKINFFDERYLDAVNGIDNLFQNDYTAKEYRDKFYQGILHGYINRLIGDKYYASSAFSNLKKTQIPNTDFFISILSSTEETILGSSDIKKGKISGYEMVSDYYLMRMPIYFSNNDYSLTELNDIVFFNSNTWSEDLINKKFIAPLLGWSRESGDTMVSSLKNIMKNQKCENIFKTYFNKKSVGKDIYNTTIKNCKNNSWKRGATELWLINRFEKKLRIKKYNDWNVYLQRTLWENRLRKIMTPKIKFDKDNYLNFESYSKVIKNSLEKKDLKFFKNNFDLNTQIKIYNQKWSQIRKGVYRLYDDVPFNHTFYNYINTLSKKNLISNVNVNYRPQDNISQYESLKIIENLLFKNEFEVFFNKIKNENKNKNKTKDDIELLKRKSRFTFLEKKVTKVSGISFDNENKLITREEIAELIIQVIYKKVKNDIFIPQSTEDKVIFTYLDKYKAQIDYKNDWNIFSTGLKAFEISAGYKEGENKGKYGLSDNISRGEIAKIFIKTFEFIRNVKGEN